MNAALESLLVTGPDSLTMRATGTTDDLSVGCNRPAETTRLQAFSTVSKSGDDAPAPPTKKPHFPAENEALRESDTQRRRWELNPRVTDLQSVALATWLRRLNEGRNLVVTEKRVKVARRRGNRVQIAK